MESFLRIALLLGDSIIANIFSTKGLKEKFQSMFSYDYVYEKFVGGADFEFIARKVFPRMMASISKNHEYFAVDVFVCVGLYSTDVLDCIQIVSLQRLIVFQAIHCFRQLLAFAKRPLASAQLCKNSQFVCASDPHHHIHVTSKHLKGQL